MPIVDPESTIRKKTVPECLHCLRNTDRRRRVGPAIGIRNNSGMTMQKTETTPDVTTASIRGKNVNLMVGNIYCSNNLARAKATVTNVADILDRAPRGKDVLLIGDWNKMLDELIPRINKAGKGVYATNAPRRETRISVQRRGTKRTIDYAVSGKEGLITT